MLGLGCLGAMSSFWACQGITNPESPTWVMDLLGPIVKAELDINSFDGFAAYNITSTAKVNEIDPALTPGVTTPLIPETNNESFSFQTTVDAFEELTIDTGTLNLRIVNNFPVEIKSGMTITITSDGEEFFSHTVTQAIAADGGIYELPQPAMLIDKSLLSTVDVAVTNVGTEEKVGLTTIEEDDEISVTLSLEDLKIQRVVVDNQQRFETESFTNFNIGSDEIKTRIRSGELTLKINNGFAFDINLQIYFTDGDRVVLDSLFDAPQLVAAAPIDGSGVPTGSTETTISSGTIDDERYDRLLGAAFMRTNATMIVPPGNNLAAIDSDDKMEIQMIGNIEVQVTNE